MIFIDESGANLQMHPIYGRAYGKTRATISSPYHRGNYMTIIGAISINKIEAIAYTEGAGNTSIFVSFIENFLCPILRKGHVVVMDNVSFHKSETVKHLIESKGAKIIYSPPYSPELNPIEEMWSKIKNSLRKLSARTKDKFEKAIKKSLLTITKSDLFGWFKHSGYFNQVIREVL